MRWPDQKAGKLKDVKLKDRDLTFSAERKLGDKKHTVEYNLTIDGDMFKGQDFVQAASKKTGVRLRGEKGEGQVAVGAILGASWMT